MNNEEIFGPRNKTIPELETEIVELRNKLQILHLAGGELCLSAIKILEAINVYKQDGASEKELSKAHLELQQSIFYLQKAIK